MLEIALIIALIGLLVAGAWDLLTTEVPDAIPYLMIVSGIFLWYINALTFGDFSPLFYSLILGTITLAAGIFLYRVGAWGGADAWLLGAVAFLIPLSGGAIFILDFVFNLLMVGSLYMVIYSIGLGFMNPRAVNIFYKDMKGNVKFIFPPLVLAIILFSYDMRLATLLFIIGTLIIFWRYAKVIEKHVFRKKIRASALKPGDVLESMIWRGITAEEIRRVRRKRKYVIIKEGVRFIPAYPAALIVTLIYGNLLYLIGIF